LIYREGVNGGRSKEEEKDRTDIKRAKWGWNALRDDGVDAMDNILIGEEVGKNSSYDCYVARFYLPGDHPE